MRGRQLAGERLHLGDLLRGENGAGGPRALDPRARPGAARRNAAVPHAFEELTIPLLAPGDYIQTALKVQANWAVPGYQVEAAP